MPKIEIHFDGGCQPNPGHKYGSFEVLLDGKRVHQVIRKPLGWGTNNEAEFEILIEALQWTWVNLAEGGFSPSLHQLEVFTDSTIVRNRLMKSNRIFKKHAESSGRMQRLACRILEYAVKFGGFCAKWQSRDRNVERFGH